MAISTEEHAEQPWHTDRSVYARACPSVDFAFAFRVTTCGAAGTTRTSSSATRGRQRVGAGSRCIGLLLPHLHRDWAHPYHICTRTRLTAATSAPGLGSPLPHLHRERAYSCHICTGTGLTPVGPPPLCGRCADEHPRTRAHVRWFHAAGRGDHHPMRAVRTRPHLHRDRAHPSHIGAETALAPDPAGRHGHTIRCARSALHTAGRVLGARVGVWSGCVPLHTADQREHSVITTRSLNVRHANSNATPLGHSIA